MTRSRVDVRLFFLPGEEKHKRQWQKIDLLTRIVAIVALANTEMATDPVSLVEIRPEIFT